MKSNVVLFGWSRSIPGRENLSSEHFQEFIQYLSGLRDDGQIELFVPVFLDPHGGDMNGFFFITGEPANLDAMVSSDEWITHITRATHHLIGHGVVRGATGEAVMERMNLWTSLIPGS